MILRIMVLKLSLEKQNLNEYVNDSMLSAEISFILLTKRFESLLYCIYIFDLSFELECCT